MALFPESATFGWVIGVGIAATVLHGSGSRAHWPLPRPGSSGADVIRASELQHAVEHVDRHVHLSRPTLVRTRAQPVPDHALEPADGGLGPGARCSPRPSASPFCPSRR